MYAPDSIFSQVMLISNLISVIQTVVIVAGCNQQIFNIVLSLLKGKTGDTISYPPVTAHNKC